MNGYTLRLWAAGSNSRRAALLAAVLSLFPSPASAKLNVVATTADLASLAKVVGGEEISLTTLAKPTEDPHFVDAKPSFVLKLNHADVLIEGGAELEIGWLPPLLEGSRNPKIAAGAPGRVACAEGLSLLEVPTALDRSKGDIHAAGNPHYLVDPVNAKAVAGRICDALCQADAKSSERYHANLGAFTQLLDTKLDEWQKLLAPFNGQHLVAYHNMWPYFGRRFGLQIDLFLEPKPGIPPSPAHLADVINRIKTGKIRAIIVEPYQSRKTAEKVAADTGAAVLDVTQYPGGLKETQEGYVAMMDYLVQTLVKGLKAEAR